MKNMQKYNSALEKLKEALHNEKSAQVACSTMAWI